MIFFKKRRNEKINKFKQNLIAHGFDYKTRYKLVSMYQKVLGLSNIFIEKITMIIISIILMWLSTKLIELIKFKVLIFSVFGTLSSILIIVAYVLTFSLFFQVLFCKIPIVKKKILLWAILSLIPLLSWISLFIMKWKIAHIYLFK